MKRIYTPKKNTRQGYADSIEQTKQMFSFRIIYLLMAILTVIILLSGRVVQLQVVQGQQLRDRSDSNRILTRSILPARGVIYDSTGEPLVINHPVQRLLTSSEGRLMIESNILSRDEVLKLEATNSGRLVSTIGRFYPYKESSAHVVGYVGEADPTELEEYGLSLGEMVGKAGIETIKNYELMGTPGTELVELDATGKVLRRITQSEPKPGKDVVLHINVDYQQVLYDLLKEHRGAAIVSNPQLGSIQAMVSTPSFDPNIFGYTPEELGIDDYQMEMSISDLLQNTSQPLLNRAISGTYPPGSVYKVVPSLAGLETDVIKSSTEVDDTGVISIDQYQFRNWYYTQYGRTEGLVDLTTALKRSNDIYYYKLGEWLGIEHLSEWSRLFGLGSLTEIDLPAEKTGLVPDPLWKERTKNERWFLGNTYHMSIGQGDLLTTPLQVHQMMGVIATRGKLCKPQLIQSIGDDQLIDVDCQDIGANEENIEAVVDGLIAACQSGGTAYPFFDFPMSQNENYSEDDTWACKTGTAQFFDKEGRTHAWFSVFAPAVNPEIMVTVLVEAGGEGSAVAAPIAKNFLEMWLSNQDYQTFKNQLDKNSTNLEE